MTAKTTQRGFELLRKSESRSFPDADNVEKEQTERRGAMKTIALQDAVAMFSDARDSRSSGKVEISIMRASPRLESGP